MIRIVSQPAGKLLRVRCPHCMTLLEFNRADVARIRGASYINCVACTSEISIVTMVQEPK